MGAAESTIGILLVEDNPNDARLIRRHLEGTDSALLPAEVTLTHETTLADAAGTRETDAIDLVLLDLGLPGSSGAETFERASERLPPVPIVVLTNLTDGATAVDLLQRGAQDYLNKGDLNEATLVRTVRYAIEREERERALRETNEQLEVLNRILRHDIRNDVQVIRAWSETLLAEVPAEREGDVRKIARTAEHIRELTDNSRAFIRTVTGEGDLEAEALRIDDLLEAEMEKARSIYPAASVSIAGDLPPTTVAANGMLSSVFRNLLNNAVKHTRGDPEIEVALRERGTIARVTVADNGPGVPDEHKETIFGRGERGIESEGTGIGLYLVDTIVDAFDGDVWVEDRPDDGAVFVVELPIWTE